VFTAASYRPHKNVITKTIQLYSFIATNVKKNIYEIIIKAVLRRVVFLLLNLSINLPKNNDPIISPVPSTAIAKSENFD
jgi:hypothetical protein